MILQRNASLRQFSAIMNAIKTAIAVPNEQGTKNTSTVNNYVNNYVNFNNWGITDSTTELTTKKSS